MFQQYSKDSKEKTEVIAAWSIGICSTIDAFVLVTWTWGNHVSKVLTVNTKKLCDSV